MIAPVITDHALLRWMERRYGVPVEEWRRLAQDELRAALDAYDGLPAEHGPAFVLSPTAEKVVTVLGPGQAPSPYQHRSVVLPIHP